MLAKGFHNIPQKQHYRPSWVQPLRTGFHNIPQLDWACPPRFLVDPNWKMEAGAESREAHIQLQRESRIAEVIYYRDSDIPPNPYVASNALEFNDGSRIPVTPLDVINDETSPDDPLVFPGPTVKVGEKTTCFLPRDEVTGTALALVALIISKEPGSQIDLELLTQLLCNPGMLNQLTKEHGLSANQRAVITHVQPHEHSPVPLPPNRGVRNIIEQMHSNSESQNPISNKNIDLGKIRKLINEYGVHLRDDPVKPGPVVVKDEDYYRRLISLHGISQEKPTGSQKQRPCAYFNSAKGCRDGPSCRFRHITGGSGAGSRVMEEPQGAKRVKLSGGNFARYG